MLMPLTGRSRHEAMTLGGAGRARLGRPSAKALEASTRSAASPPASIRLCRVICLGLGTRQDLIGGSDGGEGEIRTLDGPVTHNGFRDRRLQPLGHLSESESGGPDRSRTRALRLDRAA